MKLAVMILNAMFLLLFISAVIGEWGEPPALIVSIVINTLFILIKIKGDFEV